jgi:glycosyltransferase involved in cell wall biosynthesis
MNKNFFSNRGVKNSLPSDFNSDEYLKLNPDLIVGNIDPEFHYLNHGFYEGRAYKFLDDTRHSSLKKALFSKLQSFFYKNLNSSNNSLPSNFNEEEYLDLNPDLRQAQILPAAHYLRHGVREGRLYSLSEKYKQYQLSDKDKNKKTILLISHEATRTGAPILSLSLIKEFSAHYNVVVFLLQGGELLEYFLSSSAVTIVVGEVRGQPILAGCILDRLADANKFEYSIVNSLESSLHVLPALAKNLIPTLNLVHEYSSCYARSEDVLKFLCNYPGEVVFSCQSTYDDARTIYPGIQKKIIHILPQGKSDIPKKVVNIKSQNEASMIRSHMRPRGPDGTIVVLGAGPIYLRKGVDLFIQIASKVIQMNPEKKYHFVWIGKPVDEDIDLSYGVFIKDQIKRSGLEEVVTIIDETPEFAVAFEQADLCLISSRLDPLPNVAIDAMAQSIPVLCFENATGVAEYLDLGGLREYCIAKYLDCEGMALKIISLSDSSALRGRVGKACAKIFEDNFQIDKYVQKLEKITLESKLRTARDIDDIVRSGFFNESFYKIPGEDNLCTNELVKKYVQEWQVGQFCRKPMPGFHPGIYRECNKLTSKDGDPFAHYLRNSRPNGKWITSILPHAKNEKDGSDLKKIKSILHIHIHYPELLNEILERIKLNKNHPDLFVSISTGVRKAKVDQALKSYPGVIVDILETPNRGRDIGPFLTEFLGKLTKEYEYIGHIHTKKSTHVKENIGRNWYVFLMENLIGGVSGGMIDRVLAAMYDDSSLGLIFPDDPNCCDWGKNLPFAKDLAVSLGINPLENQFNFPVGTMFWARSAAINDFVKLKLNWDDYPVEPLPIDGTLLHAIERMIPFVVENRGYKYIATNISGISR